jgi:hypothetical protein
MSTILRDINLLINESLELLATGVGVTAVATILGVFGYIGLPLLLALSKTIIVYLLFAIFISGSLSISLDVIKYLTGIDDFISLKFKQLSSNGYNEVEVIHSQAISSRDSAIRKCRELKKVQNPETKHSYWEVPSVECSKLAIREYLKVSLSGLYSYYIKLLSIKGENKTNADSLDYILSSDKEILFNRVLIEMTARYKYIIKVIGLNWDEFENEVLEQAKQKSKTANVNPIQVQSQPKKENNFKFNKSSGYNKPNVYNKSNVQYNR